MSSGIAQNADEALLLAVWMEKRAIRLFERAMLVFADEPVYERIEELYREELTHLERFEGLMSSESCFTPEREMALSSKASELIFVGGLTEAAREGAFKTPEGFVRYAILQEEKAIEEFESYAAQTEGAIHDNFLTIVSEEQKHLELFREWLNDLTAKKPGAEERADSV